MFTRFTDIVNGLQALVANLILAICIVREVECESMKEKKGFIYEQREWCF